MSLPDDPAQRARFEQIAVGRAAALEVHELAKQHTEFVIAVSALLDRSPFRRITAKVSSLRERGMFKYISMSDASSLERDALLARVHAEVLQRCLQEVVNELANALNEISATLRSRETVEMQNRLKTPAGLRAVPEMLKNLHSYDEGDSAEIREALAKLQKLSEEG